MTRDSRWTGNRLVTPVPRRRLVARPRWAEASQRRPLTTSHRSAGRGPSFLPPSSFSGAGVSARVKFRSDLDNRRDTVWPGSLWALGHVERRLRCSQGWWPHQPKGHLEMCAHRPRGPPHPRNHMWPLSHPAVPAHHSHSPGPTEFTRPKLLPHSRRALGPESLGHSRLGEVLRATGAWSALRTKPVF